jgi:hypothetical protein
MNTNETKAKIWNMCIERGVFDKVKGDDFKKIQDIFEKIVKGYANVEPSIDIFNKVIDSITLDVQNQNKSQTISFEDIQKEYDVLLKTPIPKKIDFSDSKDPENTVVGTNDIDQRMDSNGIYQSLNQEMQFQNLKDISKESSKETNKIKLEEILMTQNKILIQILETQIKIIQGLKL